MPAIKSLVYVGFALASLTATAVRAEGSADCARLAHTFKSSAAPVVVTSELIDASPQKPWGIPEPFCRLVGSIRPTTQSNIGFEVWLPSQERWNGKFFGTATGGSAGTV